MKVGRNSPCPCGSGKKHKRCCGKPSRGEPASGAHSNLEEIKTRAEEALRAHESVENVRQQQQGFGRPILSWQDHGYRLVAVGKHIFWSRSWLVFPDFLLHFLKHTLGLKWGAKEQREGSAHPLFRWLVKFSDYNKQTPASGKLKSGSMTGFLACVLHLGYALYLIAHHDYIPKQLLRRLRDPKTFLPAYYEAIVGAALAVAGFEISNAETRSSSIPVPEYRARSKASSTVFEVEAKRKEKWKATTDNVSASAFIAELTGYVRDQVHKASSKKLTNAIFWFELSIPTLTTELDWRTIARQVAAVLKKAESLTVAGEKIAPAYVVITNHTFLANEDIAGEPTFALLEPLLISDYPYGRAFEIEEALEAYDKHRDVFNMMNGWRIARSIPITFDGTPPELLSQDGEPQQTLQIGGMLEVPNESGDIVAVRIEDVTSSNEAAWVVVYHAGTNQRWIVNVPLTKGETQAAARYTDAVFGKPNASRKLRDKDPFDLYDWILKAYAKTTKEQLVSLTSKDPALAPYAGLPPNELRKRMAREYTKRMWTRAQNKK